MSGKTISVNGIEARYSILGQGKPVLILHGWGSSLDSWRKVQEGIAEKGYQVITVDLPGFGKTPPPKNVWGVEEYADFVFQFSQKLNLTKFSLAGHSFGGQIAVQFAASRPEHVGGLVLVSAAAIRKPPGIQQMVLKYFARVVNFVFHLLPLEDLKHNARHAAYGVIGRRDYFKAQGIMKGIMRKVLMQDLTLLFSQIKTPTLLIWGDKDKLTPIQDAHVMKTKIPNATLKVFRGKGHNIHVEAREKLVETICFWLSR